MKFILKLLLFVSVTFLRTGGAAQLSAFKLRQFSRLQGTKLISLGLGAMLVFSPMSIDPAVALSEPTSSRTYVKYTPVYKIIYVFVGLNLNVCLFCYSNSAGQRLDALESDVAVLKTDVAVLKTDVNQIKVGGVAFFIVFVGAAALSFTEMKEVEKRSDAKAIVAEAKSDKKMLAMDQKTNIMFLITSLIAIVPSLMLYYSNT